MTPEFQQNKNTENTHTWKSQDSDTLLVSQARTDYVDELQKTQHHQRNI